jgi:hypothetical protein
MKCVAAQTPADLDIHILMGSVIVGERSFDGSTAIPASTCRHRG